MFCALISIDRVSALASPLDGLLASSLAPCTLRQHRPFSTITSASPCLAPGPCEFPNAAVLFCLFSLLLKTLSQYCQDLPVSKSTNLFSLFYSPSQKRFFKLNCKIFSLQSKNAISFTQMLYILNIQLKNSEYTCIQNTPAFFRFAKLYTSIMGLLATEIVKIVHCYLQTLVHACVLCTGKVEINVLCKNISIIIVMKSLSYLINYIYRPQCKHVIYSVCFCTLMYAQRKTKHDLKPAILFVDYDY